MVGIVCEYNPFHNGHLYHLNKVKSMFPNETITLILAGHFLNRGDISTINKWDKTSLALTYGIDLVIELPFIYASQSADTYALGAIKLLNYLKADYVVFGSESNDIDKLNFLANELIKPNNKVKLFLSKGFNYPTSVAKAYNMDISSPNDLLGLSYLKAINLLNSTIKPLTIKRTNNYHSNTLDEISSATSIRNAVKNNIDISKSVPISTLQYIRNISINDYFSYIKYQIITNDISKFNIDIKLANSIKNNITNCFNLDDLITSVKTKNFSYNYIKRSLVLILCGIKKEDLVVKDYIRVLGFNIKGRKYLNKIKKELSVPLLTKYNDLLKLELKITKVYALIYGEDIIKKELNKPIIF